MAKPGQTRHHEEESPMRTSMRTLLAASASGMLIATTAVAAQPCLPNSLCVVDAQGTQIGTLIGTDSITREYNGVYYNFSVDPAGIQETAFFLYISTNCTGTPYLPYDNVLPSPAVFDQNKVLWGPSGTRRINASFQSYSSGNQCYIYEYGPGPAGVAEVIDAITPKTWTPPFSITSK
jgi:hypothetical protein